MRWFTGKQLDAALLLSIGALSLWLLALALRAGPPQRALPEEPPVILAQTSAQTSGAAAENSAPALPAGEALGRVGFAYASGTGACGAPLRAWQHVAVSRDLLPRYGCGTALTLTLDDEVAGRREITARVGDTMGAGATGALNVFVGALEPALEYGVTTGRVRAGSARELP